MLNFTPFYTLSGIFVCAALVALMNARPLPAAMLLTIAGAGGLGVFWERWSQRTGDDVHVAALLHPVAPTAAQWALLTSHGALLLAGVAVVTWTARRGKEGTR
jgi:hypothetical protein